ncbi:MAG: hypothetical protein ACI4JM_03380 [Oscillospiraceae bacterium]
MQKEYIDVDYTMMSEDENADDKNTDIIINTDPASAAISGIVGVVNNITNAAKEYSICKQQEETKRAAIKAQMKVEIEKINMQKEICLKVLDEQHEIKMIQIQAFYQQYKTALDDASAAVHGAIEVAKESKNFSDVCILLETERNILKDSSEAELKFMEISQKNNYRIQSNSVKGLLE